MKSSSSSSIGSGLGRPSSSDSSMMTFLRAAALLDGLVGDMEAIVSLVVENRDRETTVYFEDLVSPVFTFSPTSNERLTSLA